MSVDDWRDWHILHSGFRWRVALPEDEQGINDVIDSTEQHLRQDQERVDCFAGPVILTLVAERVPGEIVDVVCIELVADIRKLGLDRAAMAAYPALLPVIGSFLKERGIRVAHMSTLAKWAKVMAPALKALGFRATEKIHWVRKV